MVRRVIRVTGSDPASVAALEERFAAIRARLGIPAEFPPEVLAAAEQSAPLLTSRPPTSPTSSS